MALRSRSVARGRGQRERPRACAAGPAAARGRRGGVRPHPAGSDVHERTRRAAGARDVAAGGAGMMRGLAQVGMAAGFCAAASLAAQRPAPISGFDPATFDTSVRPQDDLYRYVNGRWMDTTPIPDDRVSFSASSELTEKINAD